MATNPNPLQEPVTPAEEPTITIPQLAEDVRKQQASQSAILDKLTEIEQRLNQPPQQPQQPQQPSAPQLPPDFDWQNPYQSIDQRIAQAVGPFAQNFAQNTMGNQADMARSMAIQTNSKVRKVAEKWGSELNDALSRVTPHERTFVGTYVNAADLLIGKHYDDIRKEESSGVGFFSEPVSQVAAPAKPAELDIELTAQQLKDCKRWDITEETMKESVRDSRRAAS